MTLNEFITQYGPGLGVLLFVGVNGFIAWVLSQRAEIRSKDAATEAHKALTKAFERERDTRDKLQTQADKLEREAQERTLQYTEERQRLEADIADMKEALEAAQASAKAFADRLEQTETHAKVELEAARRRITELESRVDSLNAQVKAGDGENARMVGQLNEEKEKTRALTAEVERLKERINQLTGENSALRLLLDKFDSLKIVPQTDGVVT